MNNTHSGNANAAEKTPSASSAARALLAGLALLLPGAAAQAIDDPIPGIDIVVKCLGCKPPYHGVPVPTGSGGAYQLKGLKPGKYDLFVAGQHVQAISVDKGTISGVLSRKPDGKTSITFNGQVGVVPDLPGASVSAIRSHLPRGQLRPTDPAKLGSAGSGEVSPAGGDASPGISDQGFIGNLSSYGKAPPPKDSNDHLPGKAGHAPKPVSPGTGPHSSLNAGEPLPADEQPGISDQAAAGGLISYGTAPPPKDGAGKLPSKVGEHIPGTEIGLEGDTNSAKASAGTDVNGAVKAEKRPAGFGSGNTFGAGPAAGPGMLPPGGAGGPGAGMNPMGPGMGGPGGAMRP